MYESTGGSAGIQFAQGMALVAEGLTMLTGVDMAEVHPQAAAEAVITLVGESRRFESVQARVADRFSMSGVWAESGAKSARAWVASHTNEPVGRAGAVINTGARMREHTAMAEAFANGQVSARHVEILGAAARDFPTVRSHLVEVDESIVEVARLTTPRRFQAELLAICHSIDPTAVEKDERQRDAEAYLHLSPIGDGMWRVDGLLPAEVGAQFKAMLEATRRRLRAQERNQQPVPGMGSGEVIDIDVLGNPVYANETPTQAMDHRYNSRRNVDGLRFMLGLLAQATNPDGTIALPAVSGSRPVMHVTVELESLLEPTRTQSAAWVERFGVPTSVISASKARFLACDSRIEPMIVKDGRLVATLPSLQTVPAHLRKAVLMRDQQCRVNSCVSPIDEVHHLIFLSQGGPTTMSNLAGLCWFHHHLIHTGEWTLTGDGNEELILTNTVTGEQWTNRPPRNPTNRPDRHR